MSRYSIIFITYEYPPLGGGVANAAFHLLKELSQFNNLNIDVITGSLDNNWQSESMFPNVTLYRVPIGEKLPAMYHHQTPMNMLKFTLNSIQMIKQLTRLHPYHLVHYFGYPGAFPGYLYRRQLPYIISLRGVDVPGYNQKFGLYYHFYRPLVKKTWKQAAAVIANSDWLKCLAKKTASKLDIQVIPNGVDTTTFKPIDKHQKFAKFTITAGGTLMNSKKNLDVLIKAFSIFNQEHPSSQLMLFGSGPLESQLKKQVKNLKLEANVIFTGSITHHELAHSLPKCHLFCLPSSAEGMSNALLEAAACGLPLVISGVGAAREFSPAARIIHPISSDTLTVEFRRLYKSTNIYQQLSRQARTIANHYTWSRVAEKYITLYLDTINIPNTPRKAG